MIRHLLKLIWNRRRANGLILLELTFCFVTLCGVLTSACYWAINWNKPLGFDWNDLLRLDIDMQLSGNLTEEQRQTQRQRYHQLMLELDGMGGIVAHSPTNVCFPYSNATMGHRRTIDGKQRLIAECPVTNEGMDALGLDLLSGRWIEEGDEKLAVRPVVITRDYAEMLYDDADPVGQPLIVPMMRWVDGEAEFYETEHRVVGVVAEYRMRSEIRPPSPTQFSPVSTDEGLPPTIFAIRTEPGVTAAIQEDIFRAIRRIAPDWTAEINPVSALRDRELRANLIPLSILFVIAGFLIVMVGLGLIGVLWHAITRRTEELGIRRAVGATETRVRWLVLGELLTLTTVAVVIGSAMFLQFPILRVIGWMPWQAYVLALVVSLVIIYPFVIACGLYPAWLATKVHPAEALQHE
jgi:putative ABC transport system permease protein